MAIQTPFVLPKDFLSKPAENIIVNGIDFSKSTLPEYTGRYATIIDKVLSQTECEDLIRAAETTSKGEWERAMINIGGGRQQHFKEARNCGRIIWDSREIVAKIWKRIEHLPEVNEITRLEGNAKITGNGPAKRGEVWKFTRPNERMRFLKYVGGEYFRPHCDGTYETPDRTERSYFTLHLYLNDAGLPEPVELEQLDKDERTAKIRSALVGGATTFHTLSGDDKKDMDVVPKTGRILIFQHRDLLHSGDDVVQGVKYTMRTDLMYALEST